MVSRGIVGLPVDGDGEVEVEVEVEGVVSGVGGADTVVVGGGA